VKRRSIGANFASMMRLTARKDGVMRFYRLKVQCLQGFWNRVDVSTESRP